MNLHIRDLAGPLLTLQIRRHLTNTVLDNCDFKTWLPVQDGTKSVQRSKDITPNGNSHKRKENIYLSVRLV